MNKIYEIASNVCENNMDEIKAAIKRVIALDYVARYEGLLAMEGYVLEQEEYPEKTYVTLIVGYIVDAVEWEEIEGMLKNRILMMENDKKRYLCFFYKECLKMIKTGKFSIYQKDCICSLVPDKYQSSISAFVEEVGQVEYEKWTAKKNEWIIKEYSQIEIDIPEEVVESMRAFEQLADFKPQDFYTQAWLRRMDYSTVYKLMLAGSEEFKEVMLSNMSSRMKMMAKEQVVELAKRWNPTNRSIIDEAILHGIAALNEI